MARIYIYLLFACYSYVDSKRSPAPNESKDDHLGDYLIAGHQRISGPRATRFLQSRLRKVPERLMDK